MSTKVGMVRDATGAAVENAGDRAAKDVVGFLELREPKPAQNGAPDLQFRCLMRGFDRTTRLVALNY